MAAFKPWEPASKKTIRVAGGPTKNPKKLTGSRLGAVLGQNKWKSPFEAWCEITRVGEQPFEGNKYTDAGTALEPKIIEWCKANVSPYIVTPFEWFGKTTQEMGYDHFPTEPVFGGMWDALVLDKAKGKPLAVIEAKTSSRPQDWAEGVPESYAVQGLAYALLLGVDRVFFPVRFMDEDEYEHPELCECTDDNTFIYDVRVTDATHAMMDEAMAWYDNHVVGNVSPPFDEKRDKAILAIIRKSEVKVAGLETLAKEALELDAKIAAIIKANDLDTLNKQLDALKKRIKPELVKQFKPTDEAVVSCGWQVKRTSTESIDKEMMEADGILAKYTKTEERYTLTKSKENN